MPATERPEKRRRVATASSRSEVIDVAKSSEGVIVIRTGEQVNGNLIRVHSTFLKMGSPVFRAMLGGGFIEGSIRYTADSPLCLEEDDAKAMWDLCCLLHHQ